MITKTGLSRLTTCRKKKENRVSKHVHIAMRMKDGRILRVDIGA